ncbi:MAG: aldo/keto reductase [Acidobacteriota bacterium]|nr:aldo/keto reductase [Acidobacteriota bacterium]
MEYRRLGGTGLKLSVLSLGSWVTFGPQVDTGLAVDVLAAAREAGVNFFDNAEAYSAGESERIMGAAVSRLGWPRKTYVISTKLFWGLGDEVNMHDTLNRKYLLQAIDGSLERLGLDFVDLLFCHRPDPETPIEETVWAMSDIVASGKALYWGTSEWSAEDIRRAWDIADRHGMRKPVVEQPQYNLFWRSRVEQEYAPLYDDIGLGLTTYSPLASGLLSGKYASGVPEGSRASLPGYEWLRDVLVDPRVNGIVTDLAKVASDLDCTTAQLALAWCALNPHVSTVMTGASSVRQLEENMAALDVRARLDDEVVARVEAIAAAY